jgi:signal transduction histidine kinase/DNA-binding response OmpR family regulator
MWQSAALICLLAQYATAQTLSVADQHALERARHFLHAYNFDSTLAIVRPLLADLHSKKLADSPIGLHLQLMEGKALLHTTPDTALTRLLPLIQKSSAAGAWDIFAEASLLNALIFEWMGRKESAREWLDTSLVTIRRFGLDSVYPHYAIRNASWHRLFDSTATGEATSLYYAQKALRTAIQHRRPKETADGHLFMSILQPHLPLQYHLDHTRSALRLFRAMGDYNGVSSAMGRLAFVYTNAGQYQNALKFQDSSIHIVLTCFPEGYDKLSRLSANLASKSRCYERMGLLDSAMVYLKKSHQAALSGKDYNFAKSITGMDNELVRRRMKEQGLVLRTRNTQLLFVLLTGVVVLLLAAGLFTAYRRQQKARKALAGQNALIRQQSEQLRTLDSAKSRFFTNVSHEFRTPLTVILGLTEQLELANTSSSSDSNLKNHAGHSSPAGVKLQESLVLIRRNGESLLRLINQILDLSKMDNGVLKAHWQRGDIVAYLQYLTESFYSLAQERDVRLVFYPETKYLEMDYDAEKMQAIVTNLLSNALKFTGRTGKVVLHVKLAPPAQSDPAGPECLQLVVRDTGKGIPEAELPHIFDRFYQVDDSTTRRGEGTGIGIGLAYVKELVQLLGGGISVESTVGMGSSFRLLFPIQKQAEVSALPVPLQSATRLSPLFTQPASTLSDASPRPTDAPSSKSLLLIEDNPDVAAYLRSLLEADYQIEWADNGQAGIDKAIAFIPDIIISDVMMPEKDGYEVCDILKNDERTNHIPIILLTAKAAQSDKIVGLRKGADAYLEKPFHREELMIRLEKLVELRTILQARYASNRAMRSGAENLRVDLPAAKAHESLPIQDPLLERLHQIVLQRLGDARLDTALLCRQLQLSNIQLHRKLKALTGETPLQYIRQVRLSRARHMLQTTSLNVSEIAYETGFNDPNYFSRLFQEHFGETPVSARRGKQQNLPAVQTTEPGSAPL